MIPRLRLQADMPGAMGSPIAWSLPDWRAG
jgi:hypothetical protein